MEVWLENVEDVYEQLDELLQDYFAKTIAKEGLPPLHMNWPMYIELNKRGSLLLFTARSRFMENLLGFVMYHVHEHLHHMGVMMAACDILAVGVEYRGAGTARKMVEHAETVLRDRGVKQIIHMFRTCYNTEPLFPKLGYKLFEQSYIKELN